MNEVPKYLVVRKTRETVYRKANSDEVIIYYVVSPPQGKFDPTGEREKYSLMEMVQMGAEEIKDDEAIHIIRAQWDRKRLTYDIGGVKCTRGDLTKDLTELPPEHHFTHDGKEYRLHIGAHLYSIVWWRPARKGIKVYGYKDGDVVWDRRHTMSVSAVRVLKDKSGKMI